jgi:hypothetical protein
MFREKISNGALIWLAETSMEYVFRPKDAIMICDTKINFYTQFICLPTCYEQFWKITEIESKLVSILPITRQVNKIPTVIDFKMIDTLGLPCSNKNNK